MAARIKCRVCEKPFRANASNRYECCGEPCKDRLRKYLGVSVKSKPALQIENIKNALDNALYESTISGELDAKKLYERVAGIASVI